MLYARNAYTKKHIRSRRRNVHAVLFMYNMQGDSKVNIKTMSLATKNVATVLVGVGLILALSFAFVTPAKADILSDLQAQVQALLAQIAALSGSSTTTSGAGCYAFTMTEQMGSSGGEVMWVQKFLNSHGAQVASSGAGSPGNESNYFGALTKAALAKWQAANGVSPAAGYWGPISRAKAAMVCGSTSGNPSVPGVPVTGNGLKVMLAADSPASTSLVQGQAIGDLAHFAFSNPTGSEVTVTSLGFKRIGASSDSTVSNIYLFNGGARITDSAGISNSAFTFNDAGGLFKVPAGGTVTIAVRADIAGSTNGQQVGVQLVSVGSPTALDTSVVLPISGAIDLISSASLGTVQFTYTGPSNATDNPTNDNRVFEASTVVSTHSVWLKALNFEDRGSDNDGDLKNFRLFIDGVQVGSAVSQAVNQRVTFDLTSNPKKLETGTRTIKVVADIVGGSGETYDVQIRRAADVLVVDSELGQPILSTDAGGSFPVSAGTANNVGAASLSVVRKADSPSDNIAVGATSVLLARYEVRASGENVKIESLTASTTVTGHLSYGIDNGKVFLNGSQIGSTQDIVQGGTEFTFGSSFVARQGQIEILEVYGDAAQTDGTDYVNTDTVVVGIAIAAANTQGMDSGDTVSAITNTVGFTRTVSSSSLTMTKYSGYGNQTIVAGTNNARIGSFTISAGSTEGVNVNTITVSLSTNEAASITDLMLKDNVSGAQLGTTKVSPAGGVGGNSFSVNFSVPVSGTKTIDVYANIKSGANNGPIAIEVDGSGTGATTAQTVNFGSSSTGTLQTITVGSGTLTVSRDSGTPVNSNVIAGTAQVYVGKFNFAAVNSAYVVSELKVKVPADAATSVSNVTLKYKDKLGASQTITQALSLSSSAQSHATSTFTGLTFYVPMNDSANVDVYVDVPLISSSAKSGAAISVLLDGDEGFKAVDDAGTADTTLSGSAADINSAASSGYGTKYVKKSIPTLARLSTGYTANTVASGLGLYRFTVTADAAGSVDWRKISFAVSTSGMAATDQLIDWTLYDVTGTAVAVNTAVANATIAPYVISICPDASCTIGEAQTIGAGSTKTYELRAGTVTGWGNAGDAVTISFADDPAVIVNASSTPLQLVYNMIWSDRSANSHSTTTTDWTNGSQVKDMDNDVRSCQFGTVTTCNP